MRNTSSKYKELIKGVREFCAKIIINYADGSSQTLTELQDFKQLKFVDESSSSSEFEIGSAVIGEALITLNNRSGKFNNKTFYGAHISAYVGILVNEKPEFLEMGHYIVDEPVSPGISIALTAYDNMILLDKAYVPGITYPATLAQIAQDACVQCGVILESLQFPRSSYVVTTAPTDTTCREVMAAVAQLAGCYVKARPNGRIAITWYADAASNTISTLYSKNVCTDDVTITGITVISGETTAKSGADGYRLAISDNILLEEEKAQETADYLGNKLIGLTFRPLSVSCQSDPSIEAGDRIAVKDEKGNTYQTVVTTTTFAVLESQKIACNAASPTVNGGQRLSETSKAIIASRKYTNEAVEYERTERESAIEDLNKQLDESPGLYCTPQVQEDGSTIYYLHEKAELSDSLIVWKYTATAFGASTDGGKTYPYGFDVSGKAILDRIYVIGLDAKYIKTGTLDADIVQIINLHLKDISDSAGATLDVTLNGITADVSAKYKELDGKISDNAASIRLLPDSIKSTVKTTYIDPLTTRITDAEASIKQTADSIESKVSKGDIISTINQSAEGITISASKIDFNGSATFTDAVANASNALSTAQNASSSVTDLSNGLYNGKTVVTGECIQTGTISFGTESYINKNGRFRVGPMYSTNGTQNEQGYYDDQDVCFDKAIMINYGIEIYGSNDSAEGISYIDFHSGADVTTGDSLYDYTGRLQNYLAPDKTSQFVFSGSKTVKGTETGTCTVAVNGTIVHSSDIRLKENIEVLTESKAINLLKALNPVSYKYIGDANHNIHHGLIYQNVKEIVTDQALGNLALLQEYRGVDKKTYGALGYEELIADLIKAMQYSLKEIERLKAATTA